jgi:hypothetical protein
MAIALLSFLRANRYAVEASLSPPLIVEMTARELAVLG